MAEMKAGYKQTDIGVIPEDWGVKQLSSLGGFSKGAGVKKDEARSGRLPCVRYGELYTKHNDIIRRFHSFISEEVAKNSKRLKYGDILFACSGETKEEIGKCASFLEEGLAYAGGDIIILSPHSDNSEFLGYLLNSDKIAQQKSNLGQGDAVVHINVKSLASILIALPKPEEQKTIAAALSDVDGLIESLEQLIAKKRDVKTAAMQQLLTGKKRLPGFDGEWEEKSIKEIAPLQRGFDLPKSKVEKGSVPVAYSNGVMAYHNKAMVKGPGVYTGRSGTIGKVNYISSDYWPHNTSLWVTSFLDNDPKFVFYLFSFIGFNRFSSGSGVPTLNRNDAHDFRIIIPQSEEQTAIAAVLSDMGSEIDAFEQRLAKARSLKTGMMQELLTGKTRLIKTDKKQEVA